MKKKFEIGGRAQAKSSLLKLSIIFAVAVMLSMCIIPAMNNGDDNNYSSAAQTSNTTIPVIPLSLSELPSGAIGISNLAELQAVGSTGAGGAYPLDGTYYLLGDISGIGAFTAIGTLAAPFTGIFNGNGYTLNGMNRTAGMFGYIDGATIVNVALVGGNTTFNEASAERYVGGIVGFATGTTYITNCYNTGPTTSVSTVGGVTMSVAGILAAASGVQVVISNCYNEGAINSTHVTAAASLQHVGGIYGGAQLVTINGCYNVGNITVAGGNGLVSVGGILGGGNSGYSTVTKCYNTGDITSSGTESNATPAVGGICGINGAIQNSYNTGNISLSSTSTSSSVHSGGIMGRGGSVQNSYSVASIITSSKTAGGITTNTAPVTNTYYLDTVTITAATTSTLGAARNSTELKSPTNTSLPLVNQTFVGWDFDKIWGFDPLLNDGYPVFTVFHEIGIKIIGQSGNNVDWTFGSKSGTVNSPVGLVEYVPDGSNITLTFVPDAQTILTNVLVDGVSDPGAISSMTYTFTNLTEYHEVEVTFAKIEIQITEQPTDDFIDGRSNAAFTVSAACSDPIATPGLVYTWQYTTVATPIEGDWAPVPSNKGYGQNTSMLMVSPSDYADGTWFRCVISGYSQLIALEDKKTDMVTFNAISIPGSNTHYVSSVDDLKRVGTGQIAPSSSGDIYPWNLGDTYIQTGDIIFDRLTNTDAIPSNALRVTIVSEDSTKVDFRIEIYNGSGWDLFPTGTNLSIGFGTYLNATWQGGGNISIPKGTDALNGSGYDRTKPIFAVFSIYGGSYATASIEVNSGSSGNYYISNNSNFTPIGMPPMNTFTGSYDGRGYSIDGLNVCGVGSYGGGLFYRTNNATLMNIHLENCNIFSIRTLAGLVTTANTTKILNSTISGVVASRDSDGAAGITATMISSEIIGCINKASVHNFVSTGTPVSGGIIANDFAYSLISGCSNEGFVVIARGSAGGILGGGSGGGTGVIEKCSNFGQVTSYNAASVGGIVGNQASYFIIRDCFNVSDLQSGGEIGGILGKGGPLGISNCYNTGNITSLAAGLASGQGAGGIVGTGGSNGGLITGCYNTGDVVSYRNAAGIAGCVINDWSISDCYNTGNITVHSGGNAGGVIGLSIHGIYVTYCYNTGNISGTYVGANGSTGGLGGITGSGEDAMNYCYNTGNVIGTNAYNNVGGISAYVKSGISYCYNTGDVRGYNNVGGIAGRETPVGVVYSTGQVTGNVAVGPIIGTTYSGSVSAGYYLNQSTPSNTTYGSIITEDNLRILSEINAAFGSPIWIDNRHNLSVNNGFPLLSGESGDPLAIIQHPSDVMVVTGSTASFSIRATGDWISCQWQKFNGTDWIPVGVGGKTHSEINVQLSQNGDRYRCVVTDSTQIPIVSHEAILYVVNALHTIDTITDMIDAGRGTGGYIWPGRVVDIADGDSQRFYIEPRPEYMLVDLKIDGVSLTQSQLSDVVSDGYYQFSNVIASHTVYALFGDLVEMYVTEIPQDDYLSERSNAVFTIDTAVSDPAVSVTYQWQVDAAGDGTWSNTIIGLGQGTNMLMVSPSDYIAGTAMFRCVVTGTFNGTTIGYVETNPVTFHNDYHTIHYVNSFADLENVGSDNIGSDGKPWRLGDTYIQTADISAPVLGQGTDNLRIIVTRESTTGIRFSVEIGGVQNSVSGIEYAFGKVRDTGTSPLVVSDIDSGLVSGETMVAAFIVTYNGKTYSVAVDVNTNSLQNSIYVQAGGNFTPVGTSSQPFTGLYDGNGYVIRGLNIFSDTVDNVGLFGFSSSGAIENVRIEGGSSMSALSGGVSSSVGGIVGSTDGAIRNSVNANTVFQSRNGGIYNTGGIAGGAWDNGPSAIVTNCINEGTVYGDGSVGGVIGTASCNVTECYNYGMVLGEGHSVGGIIGAAGSSVVDCHNSGYIYGKDYLVGGIVGRINTYSVANVIKDCSNSGNIETPSNRTTAGGIVGSTNGTFAYQTLISNSYNTGNVTTGAYAGGIAGTSQYTIIQDCFNTGDVTVGWSTGGGIVSFAYGTSVQKCYNAGSITGNVSYNPLGGIIGWAIESEVSDSYNAGAVTATGSNTDATGGIIGQSQDNSGMIIERCYNTGIISGTVLVGGILGTNPNSGLIADAYYLMGTVASPNGFGVEKDANFIKSLSSEASWDFVGTWVSNNGTAVNGGFPTLLGSETLGFVLHPADKTVESGFRTSVKAQATGNGISYQWQISTDNGLLWVDISGAVVPILLLDNVSTSGYIYRCVVTDRDGNTINSREATITVVSTVYKVYTETEMTKTGPGTGGYVYPVAAPNVYPDKRDTNVVGGNSVTYDIIPRPGFRLVALTLDGNDQMSSSSLVDVGSGNYTYTITGVGADHILIATFSDGYDVDVVIAGGAGGDVDWFYNGGSVSGTISGSGGTILSVPSGENVVVEFVPDTDYITASVLIDGVENSTAVSTGQYTFTSIGQAHTVQVTFVKVEILITEEPVDDFIDDRSNAVFQVTAVGSVPGITLTYA